MKTWRVNVREVRDTGATVTAPTIEEAIRLREEAA